MFKEDPSFFVFFSCSDGALILYGQEIELSRGNIQNLVRRGEEPKPIYRNLF